MDKMQIFTGQTKETAHGGVSPWGTDCC